MGMLALRLKATPAEVLHKSGTRASTCGMGRTLWLLAE